MIEASICVEKSIIMEEIFLVMLKPMNAYREERDRIAYVIFNYLVVKCRTVKGSQERKGTTMKIIALDNMIENVSTYVIGNSTI